MFGIKWNRYLMRKYVYAIFLFIFVLLLIRWNQTPEPGTTGSRFQAGVDEWDSVGGVLLPPSDQFGSMPTLASDPRLSYPVKSIAKMRHSESVDKDQLPKPAGGKLKEDELIKSPSEDLQPLFRKPKGNVIALTIYMESLCPDTTGFVKRQLVPTFEMLRATERVNYTIVPFGKAQCDRRSDDFVCECQHGGLECLLNQLMNCVIDRLPAAVNFVPIIGCIQGQRSLDAAFHDCLENHPDRDWLRTCSTNQRGRYLHALAGERTALLGSAFNFVPWVVLDGKRVNDAFYALEENICKRLDAPKPIQCAHFA